MEKNNSKILALKYRPKIFKDLIGQEIISQTISNAIKINKTPNAYLLTGIRGVGKTTTAWTERGPEHQQMQTVFVAHHQESSCFD